jgi:hypothetical protein
LLVEDAKANLDSEYRGLPSPEWHIKEISNEI